MECGGPEVYSGRDMIAVHKGTNISNEECMAVLDDIMLVLDRHRVEEGAKKDRLYMAFSVKSQVVRV